MRQRGESRLELFLNYLLCFFQTILYFLEEQKTISGVSERVMKSWDCETWIKQILEIFTGCCHLLLFCIILKLFLTLKDRFCFLEISNYTLHFVGEALVFWPSIVLIWFIQMITTILKVFWHGIILILTGNPQKFFFKKFARNFYQFFWL